MRKVRPRVGVPLRLPGLGGPRRAATPCGVWPAEALPGLWGCELDASGWPSRPRGVEPRAAGGDRQGGRPRRWASCSCCEAREDARAPAQGPEEEARFSHFGLSTRAARPVGGAGLRLVPPQLEDHAEAARGRRNSAHARRTSSCDRSTRPRMSLAASATSRSSTPAPNTGPSRLKSMKTNPPAGTL